MKKFCLGFLIFICLFLVYDLNVLAVENFYRSDFNSLSDEVKEKSIINLVNQISKELKLDYTPTTLFADEWIGSVVAKNSAQPDLKREFDTIYFFRKNIYDENEALIEGYTLEQYIVKVAAHEVRHSYQAQHALDDSDYGRNCLNGFNNNSSAALTDNSVHDALFIEQDAEAYGVDYMNRFFSKKVNTITDKAEVKAAKREFTKEEIRTREIEKEKEDFYEMIYNSKLLYMKNKTR